MQPDNRHPELSLLVDALADHIGAQWSRLAAAGYRVEQEDMRTVAYAPDGSVVWTELTFPFSEAEDQIICWEKCAQHAREAGR